LAQGIRLSIPVSLAASFGVSMRFSKWLSLACLVVCDVSADDSALDKVALLQSLGTVDRLASFPGSGSKTPAVYIYTLPELNNDYYLVNCSRPDPRVLSERYTENITRTFADQVRAAGLETHDPEEADWFLVPFDLDLSRALECNPPFETHEQRVGLVLVVLNTTQYFRRKQGADHFWFGMWWEVFDGKYFPLGLVNITENMTFGRHVDTLVRNNTPIMGVNNNSQFALDMGAWYVLPGRCTVTVPIWTSPDLLVAQESFEQWMNRPISFFFRGTGSRQCGLGADAVRNRTQELVGTIPDALIEEDHADTFEDYKKEISSSRFCLVMRCDDPQTSRWLDSLAAGCIPVIVSRGFGLMVSPFKTRINYQSFSINIDEGLWESSPVGSMQFAYNLPRSRLRSLHSQLFAVRSSLLWSHPESKVGVQVLREASEQCSE